MENFIEVKLKVDKRIIIETLERIGIANRKEKILYPSCYYFSIQDKDYILHFKQLFLLMRRNSYNNISLEDVERRNSVIYRLKEWDLIDVDENGIIPHEKFVYVLPYAQKYEWLVKHKYNIDLLYGEENV
jgi:hypothetical protein